MTQALVPGNGGAGSIVREGFGSRELERRGETASTALQAQARAEIEARYVMALQRPRSFDDVRVKLLAECKRPGFAARAIYAKPQRGATGRITGREGFIEGLSVRFAEQAIRIAGNIYQPTQTIYDDDYKRVVRVACVDLETNSAYSKDIIIEKTVERREPRDRVVLGERKNSTGQTVFIVQSTEEELLVKENALASRALRTEALRLIPPDILEDCEKAILETRTAQDAKDPDAGRKAVADAFAKLGVMPTELESYLGHALSGATPKEIGDLRGLYSAIQDGEVTFADALRAVSLTRDVPAPDDEKGQAAAAEGKKVVEKLRARAAKRAEKPAAESPQPTTTAQGATGAAAPTAPVEKQEAKPEPKPATTVPAGETCITCGNPVGADAIEVETAFGVIAHRHPGCPAPAGREPGQEG